MAESSSVLTCFNCGTSEGAQAYSFDLDLPTMVGCPNCVFALSQGDQDLLDALKPRQPRKRAPRKG